MAYTTIDDGSAYFQVALYTGTGSNQSITNGGNSDLQPDWVWVKDRSATNDHKLTDSNRLSSGNPTITLESNTDAAEYDDADPAATTSFNSDGFTIGTNGNYNTNTNTYVAWQWKANGGTLTTNDASATSVGSLDSVYQANTTAGFSIVTYTGAGGNQTIAHGLGAVPSVMMIKRRDDAGDWTVYHSTQGDEKFLRLNANNALGDQATYFNDTTPTSTVFTVGSAGDVNTSSGTHVAYCFTDIQGYSKFGNYTGNGNTGGPFIYLGFKPALIIVKATDADNWRMYDHKRANGHNVINVRITADTNSAESQDDNECDFLSNGVKFRSSSGGVNSSGQEYTYMAWAEHPFVSSAGVPVTAE
tara:strand:- start:764 stop:1840 length:1077 start_codon:yes stop_codon:yes gene_type:complete